MSAAAGTLDAMTLAADSDGDAEGGLDLVTICILAVNRLAPATLRSAVSGIAGTASGSSRAS